MWTQLVSTGLSTFLLALTFVVLAIALRRAAWARRAQHWARQLDEDLKTPIFLLAEMTNAAPTLYVSPLHYLLGTGQEFFEVSLYVMDETTGRARFRFFAPWATAAAFVAGLGLILAFHERSKRWFVFGIAATTIVCILSGSRLSVVALPAILLAVLLMSQLSRPATWLMLAGLATIGLLAFDTVVYAYQDATDAFTAARAASSRVRAALGNIAVHRWWTEAPVFGHGALEPGGHVVQRMLIGSHHTWWGLLFVKGAVGFAALAVPLGWSLVELTIKAQRDRVARIGLGIILAILMFSLGDNVEIIAYLIWPSLVFLGIALRRRIFWPYVAYLGSRR